VIFITLVVLLCLVWCQRANMVFLLSRHVSAAREGLTRHRACRLGEQAKPRTARCGQLGTRL
jgi:hypothetical protein